MLQWQQVCTNSCFLFRNVQEVTWGKKHKVFNLKKNPSVSPQDETFLLKVQFSSYSWNNQQLHKKHWSAAKHMCLGIFVRRALFIYTHRKLASDSAVLHPLCSRMGFLCMEDVWMHCPSAPQPYRPRHSTYTTAHWQFAVGTLHLTAVTQGQLNGVGWGQHLQSTLGVSKHYFIIYHRSGHPLRNAIPPVSPPAPPCTPTCSGTQQPPKHLGKANSPHREMGAPTCYQATGGTSHNTSPDQPICPHPSFPLDTSFASSSSHFSLIPSSNLPQITASCSQATTALSRCQHLGLWALQLPQASYSEPAMQTHDFTPCLSLGSDH